MNYSKPAALLFAVLLGLFANMLVGTISVSHLNGVVSLQLGPAKMRVDTRQ